MSQYALQNDGRGKLSARNLIFGILDAGPDLHHGVNHMQRVAEEWFDIKPAALRVALGRMVEDGTVISAGRGQYQAGARMVATQRLWHDWRQPEDRLKSWHGGWRMLYLGNVARTPKKSWKEAVRIMRLSGFVERDTHLWVRPDNFRKPLGEMMQGMRDSGLSDQVMGYIVDECEETESARLTGLYDIDALQERYRAGIDWLKGLEAQAVDMTSPELARMYFLCGADAIRQVVYDPLLPEEMMDPSGRRAYLAHMSAFIDDGNRIWKELTEQMSGQG